MKRRPFDCRKLRPIKRNKIADSVYNSSMFVYLRFLVLWAFVIFADMAFHFRFEYLWPFWLLLRSVHDSYKYKGLAFSVMFVCISLTSDLVCLFLIPIPWLMFVASTYVWVQYVWHTEKGFCLPTIILWMIFIYMEVGIRWKEDRSAVHLDLCRPFAAHCIGYPVVTLSFGIKSYVGYRMRQRKQREVAKENEFYMQLMSEALPSEVKVEKLTTTTLTAPTSAIVMAANGFASSGSSTMRSILNVISSSTDLLLPATNLLTTAVAELISSTLTTATAITTTTVLATAAATSTSASAPISLTTTTTTTTTTATTASGGGGSSNSHTLVQANGNLARHSPYTNSGNQLHASSHHNCNGKAVTAATTLATAVVAAMSLASSTSTSSSLTTTPKSSTTAAAAAATATGAANTTSKNITAQNGASNSKRRSVEKEKGRNVTPQTVKCCNGNLTQLETNAFTAAATTATAASKSKEKNDKKLHHANGTLSANFMLETTTVEQHIEKTKARRNRGKKDNASKDNQQNHQNSNNSRQVSQQHNKQNYKNSNTSSLTSSTSSSVKKSKKQQQQQNNNDTSSVSSLASSTTSSTNSSSVASAITHLAAKVVAKMCESCLKLEADVKKYRSELSHMKQLENELRQKLDSNLTTKSSLLTKQKECEELEKRLNDLSNARHNDLLAIQNFERRLAEERRQKQSLDAQLVNEKKARKLAEDKAARPECSTQCKQRKQQMDDDNKRLRSELKQTEESKQLAEQQGRSFEQEFRILETKLRNSESNQQDSEKLMNTLAEIQERNATLEKHLSAETRVKLDLFSALGAAKRQLELSEAHSRSKDQEIHELKAKIAQMLAVMPDATLCMKANPGNGMLRLNEAPSNPNVGGGAQISPNSPMLGNLNSVSPSVAAGASLHQLNARIAVSSPMNIDINCSSADYGMQHATDYIVSNAQQQHHMQQQQQHLQHQQQQQLQHHLRNQRNIPPVTIANAINCAVGISSANAASSLDPNASVYTPSPKSNGNAVVCPKSMQQLNINGQQGPNA